VTQLHRNLVYNLKRRRAFLAISQMELAERAGVSAGYVGEVEMGRKYPSAETLERLASALGVKPYRLLMGEEDVADIGGSEAVYEAADLIKETIIQGLDSAVRSLVAPSGPSPGGSSKAEGGKPGSSRVRESRRADRPAAHGGRPERSARVDREGSPRPLLKQGPGGTKNPSGRGAG
jgi:transcriptional regulator with XRE-family HTH domain